MKRVKQKNQIIITFLALLIAVSGYLHFISEEGDNAQTALNDETNPPIDEGIETTIGQISTQDIENKNNEIKENGNVGSTLKPTDKNNEKKDSEENSDKDVEKENNNVEKEKETEVPDSATIGQAVLVNTTINADYFYTAKLGREQVRSKNTETLMEIVNNKGLSDKEKEAATQEIINITKAAELENAIENLLAAKGFENCVVSVGKESADVVVDISSITLEQAAIIEDVVMRKTGFSSGNIVITPINGE